MPKIMLVEDDNNLREIYGERLMAEGYEIVSASDGEEALALAVKENPDLIISDVMMPKISGFDMLDILRQTPETKDTKVIMMTALSQSEDKDRADKLGADKYLVKSQVTLEDVARVVHDLIYGPDDSPGSEASAGPETATQEPAVVAPSPLAEAPEAVNTNVDPVVAVATPPINTNEQVAAPVVATPEPVAEAAIPAEPFNIESMVVEPTAPTVDNIVATTANASDNEGEPVVLNTTAAESIDAAIAPAIPSQDFTVPDLSTPPSPAPVAVPEPAVAPVAVTEPVAPVDAPEPVTVQVPAPEPTMPVANPILGDQPQIVSNVPEVSSADAQTTEDETAQIAEQINKFISTKPDVPAQHESPLVEPTEQELIHAQNAVEDPSVLQPAVDAGIATPKSDPTVPQVVPADDSNPEPAGARKKVISPLNDSTSSGPNIYELYEKEMAEEAANSPVTNPGAGASVDAETNPIVGSQADVPPAALETIDASLIEGVTFGEEQPLPPLPEPRTMAEAPTPPAPDPITPENPQEPAPDPNDPNTFAL